MVMERLAKRPFQYMRNGLTFIIRIKIREGIRNYFGSRSVGSSSPSLFLDNIFHLGSLMIQNQDMIGNCFQTRANCKIATLERSCWDQPVAHRAVFLTNCKIENYAFSSLTFGFSFILNLASETLLLNNQILLSLNVQVTIPRSDRLCIVYLTLF